MAGRADCLKLARVSENTTLQGSKFKTITVPIKKE